MKSRMKISLFLFVCVAVTSMIYVAAQAPAAAPADPLSSGQKMLYTITKTNLIRAAEKMPEENFAFRPTEEVKTFAQILGHVADSQYAFASAVLGAENPKPDVEKSKTTKAEIVQALKDAFAYADKAYDTMTDAQAAQSVKFFGRDQAKLTILSFNAVHNYEHYGNLVTYMRMKGLVPPSSEPRQ
jgi:uncharacterized damage-inducible protein DinB